jgi:hypothetical protein
MSGSGLEGIHTLSRIASYSKHWFLPLAIITTNTNYLFTENELVSTCPVSE